MARVKFQTVFFTIIFVVSILTSIKMYMTHKENLASMDCVDRTRQLLDWITDGKTTKEFIIWPYDQQVIDSAKILLDTWGREARFDQYTERSTSTGKVQEIFVFYPGPAAGPSPFPKEFEDVGIHVTWMHSNMGASWRAGLEIQPTASQD